MTESPGRRNIHGKRNSSLVVNEFIIKLRLLAGEGEHSLQDHSHRLLIINFPDDCDLPKLIFGRGDKTGHISGSHRIASDLTQAFMSVLYSIVCGAVTTLSNIIFTVDVSWIDGLLIGEALAYHGRRIGKFD